MTDRARLEKAAISTGQQVRKHPDGNTYRVVRESAGCWELECVAFTRGEDLGDAIHCTQIGQRLWVAGYFVRHFDQAPVI